MGTAKGRGARLGDVGLLLLQLPLDCLQLLGRRLRRLVRVRLWGLRGWGWDLDVLKGDAARLEVVM